MTEVILYGRTGCGPCVEARHQLEALRSGAANVSDVHTHGDLMCTDSKANDIKPAGACVDTGLTIVDGLEIHSMSSFNAQAVDCANASAKQGSTSAQTLCCP